LARSELRDALRRAHLLDWADKPLWGRPPRWVSTARLALSDGGFDEPLGLLALLAVVVLDLAIFRFRRDLAPSSQKVTHLTDRPVLINR